MVGLLQLGSTMVDAEMPRCQVNNKQSRVIIVKQIPNVPEDSNRTKQSTHEMASGSDTLDSMSSSLGTI